MKKGYEWAFDSGNPFLILFVLAIAVMFFGYGLYFHLSLLVRVCTPKFYEQTYKIRERLTRNGLFVLAVGWFSVFNYFIVKAGAYEYLLFINNKYGVVWGGEFYSFRTMTSNVFGLIITGSMLCALYYADQFYLLKKKESEEKKSSY